MQISPFNIEQISWVENGFFYHEGRPGKHPYHDAGLYYIQEPTNFEIVNVQKYEGFSVGRSDWVKEPAKNIDQTIRIWPHKVKGEGHYIAVLKKIDGEEWKIRQGKTKVDASILKHYKQFTQEMLNIMPKGNFVSFNDQLYLLPEGVPSLDKLKVIRPGLHLGTFKKNRFEPSHLLALALKGDEAKHRWNLSYDSNDICAYLKGEVIEATGEKGWHVIEVDGFSIGWGKLAGNSMKNHYPKGLRWT